LHRCNSFIENPSALKKPQAKLKKMHNLGHKNNNPPKEPQPQRVEEVVRALKNGLDEYLEVHQTELDKLTAQLKDMRRNSRLGVLYDLDKVSYHSVGGVLRKNKTLHVCREVRDFLFRHNQISKN